MSAQGKINSLRAGTASKEVMEWAAKEIEDLTNMLETQGKLLKQYAQENNDLWAQLHD